MITKTTLVFLIALILSCSFLNAQTDTPPNQKNSGKTISYKHGIGVAAGFSTGYGFSYRYMHNKFGVQATCLPIIKNKNDISLSSGLTFIYKLVETKQTALYLYESNHWYYFSFYSSGEYYNHSLEDNTTKQTDFVESNGYTGLGIGFEIFLWDWFSINIMSGYAYKFGHQHSVHTEYYQSEQINRFTDHLDRSKIQPTIEAGLYYCF